MAISENLVNSLELVDILAPPAERKGTMTIEREEWVYIHTDSLVRARNFFGRPAETEVREELPGLYAIRLKPSLPLSPPLGGDREFGLLQRFLRCRPQEGSHACTCNRC